jgi:hypothetical protein
MLITFKKYFKGAGGMAHVLKRLPSKHEALSSNSSTAKTKNATPALVYDQTTGFHSPQADIKLNITVLCFLLSTYV